MAAPVNEISKTIKTVRSNFAPVDLVADLVELWTSNPKVKVPMPTAFKQFFGFPGMDNTAVKRYAHARDPRKARENLLQIVYQGVQTEQKHKKYENA